LSMIAKKSQKRINHQPSLNRSQELKLDLIKSLRADLDQNRVEGPKIDLCKT
jgi:hypothetical protein